MMAPSKPIAGDRVADRQREEAERDGDQNDVQHGGAPSNAQCGEPVRVWLGGKHVFDLRQEVASLGSAHAQILVSDCIGIREDGGGGIIGIP